MGGTPAAGRQLRAIRLADADEALHPVAVMPRREGTHLDIRIEGVAHFYLGKG